MTNKEFAEKDDRFKSCCADAHLPATTRQASKWRRGKGLAYKVFKGTRLG